MLCYHPPQKRLHCSFPIRALESLLVAFPIVMFELQPEKEVENKIKVSRNQNLLKSLTLVNKLQCKEKFSNLGSIENYVSAIRKDTDGPWRQIIVHVIEHHSCSWICVIIWKKGCTISWFWCVNISLATLEVKPQ